jgi:hypothetical protein
LVVADPGQGQATVLSCKRVQVDEIWAYVGKKQRAVTREDDKSRIGDQWTFVAIAAETKAGSLLPRRQAHEATRDDESMGAHLARPSNRSQPSRVRVRVGLRSGASSAARAKRINDPQSPVDCHPILHVLGPQPIALGEEGGSGDEGVIDSEMVSLG